MGWASGNFGLFGLKSQHVNVPVLNYIGVFLTVVGAVCFAFINPTVEKSHHEESNHVEIFFDIN